MNNISTGFGLCVLGLGVALWPIMDRFAPSAGEVHAGVPAAALATAVVGQVTPTIVWYSAHSLYNNLSEQHVVFRAWSDGTIEMLGGELNGPNNSNQCQWGNLTCGWVVISSPSAGYSAASDSNFDAKVDGADLALLLGSWGDAPRHDIPPSDCPLNLINP